MNYPASIYRGRFAPSPTGPLHFGSLVAALASFLDARANNGRWLVRIEDIDPLREIPSASSEILKTLESHHLLWDEAVRYQSARSEAYEALIIQLQSLGLAYFCPCSRKAIKENQGAHTANCRPTLPPTGVAIASRFQCEDRAYLWEDRLLGPQSIELKSPSDDFIIKRKEGYYAYQLAVVCDDVDQQISHIIRGSDLLDSTPFQLALYDAIQTPPPYFGHIPVILNAAGQKLSKQNHARAIDNLDASHNIALALKALNHPAPNTLSGAPPDELIEWAIAEWSMNKLPKQHAISGDALLSQ